MQFDQMWIGINDIEDEGVHMDLFNELNSTLKPEWYQAISNNRFGGPDRLISDCVLIVENAGIISRDCGMSLGYVCEYWP